MKILLTFCLIIVGSDAVITVSGYRGRSVQIQCLYDSGYEQHNKYLCRGECPIWPATRDVPIRSGSPAKDTRFSLYDNTTTKIFTVTITVLRTEDTNTYWCGVEKQGYDKYTAIRLEVKDDPPLFTTSQTTQSTSTHSSSVSISTMSIVLPSGQTSEHSSDKPLFETPNLIIIGVAGVLLLLLTALLFAVLIQRKKKTQAQSPDQTPQRKSSSNNCVAPPSYKSTLSNSVYSTADVPQPIYSNVGVPTASSDSLSPVYAQVKRPGRPDVYSTAQLPSANAAQSSSESLTYTAVSFDTRTSVLSIHEIENSCDYAAVNLE